MRLSQSGAAVALVSVTTTVQGPAAGRVQVRLLGPVDVTVGGIARPVSGLRRKAVLAVLALRAGEIVSTDRLIDVVWGATAPVTALNTLQSNVSYLRRVLRTKTAILARPPGYVTTRATSRPKPDKAVRPLQAQITNSSFLAALWCSYGPTGTHNTTAIQRPSLAHCCLATTKD